MSIDVRLERLYDRIELVPGVGDPRRGKLCVMSLVAFLAGEAHSDTPRTASPLICTYAVPANDGMDSLMRQKLKPFAPRIIGTADGRDGERAALLYKAMVEEVFPEALRDLQQGFAPVPRGQAAGQLFLLWPQLRTAEPDRLLAALRQADRDDSRLIDALRNVVRAYVCGMYGPMAEAAARLLVVAAQNAPSPSREVWYWNKAIDLLDRLCDVGADERVPDVKHDRVALMETILDTRDKGDNGPRGPIAGDPAKATGATPILSKIAPWSAI